MNLETIQKNNKEQIKAVATGLVFIVLIFLFIYFYQNQYRRVDDLGPPFVSETVDPFSEISLSAKSAVVWDAKNQNFVYKKNAEDILPLASLTKLMTALVAVEILPEMSKVEVNENFAAEPRDQRLLMHRNWSISDLVSFTLLTSSNGGSSAIATAAGSLLPNPKAKSDPKTAFVEYLNERAESLGLFSARFYNDSGLDLDENTGGAYGSAEEVAYLVDYILSNHPEILESTKQASHYRISDNQIVYKLDNTNSHVDKVPGVFASKTGSTDLAQANLAVAFSPGLEGPYIAVILGSTFEERFSDMDKLVKATIDRAAD